MSSLTKQAQQCITEHLYPGSHVIDATAGNGNDTLFLANAVGSTGKVYAFDVQEQAIQKTATALSEHSIKHVELYHCCHSLMQQMLFSQECKNIQAVMFNLGYLPGSNTAIITTAETTIKALNSAIELLSDSGLISVIAYPGHSGGKTELCMLLAWLASLSNRIFQITQRDSVNSNEHTPSLFLIQKIASHEML